MLSLSRVVRNAALGLFAFGLSTTAAVVQAADGGTAPVPVSTLDPAPAAASARPAVLIETTQAPAVTTDDDGTEADEEVAYPTLAAAVADQSVPSDTDEDLRCLAGAIYFESRGEPLNGQLAVAEVVLNRTQSRHFGGSVCDVVTQRGQFSFVRGGRVPAAPNNRDWRTAVAVAKVAMKNAWESDATNALYFNGRRAGLPRRVRVAAIGHHIFYR
ncbi:cell wall hydrolase [Sphingomonas sp.]|jgi:spore germination cell wall hydrolase CwlJ-like protein|uniref:cell wall hydrolase n=1 Tax=Sphingomonas sp. TaxID=28214 RepID=UPI0035C78D50